MSEERFDRLIPNGPQVHKEIFQRGKKELLPSFVLENGSIKARIIPGLGNIIQGLSMIDKFGRPVNIVVGFDRALDYVPNPNAIGNLVAGPVAGKISDGAFVIGDTLYRVPTDNGRNLVNSGNKGFHYKDWTVLSAHIDDNEAVVESQLLTRPLTSETGVLTINNRTAIGPGYLDIQTQVETTEITVVNPAPSIFFNLEGAGRPIDNHELMLYSDEILNMSRGIPTGGTSNPQGTWLNFRGGNRLHESHPNHYYYLQEQTLDSPLLFAGYLFSAANGVLVRTYTNTYGVNVMRPNSIEGIAISPMLEPDGINLEREVANEAILAPGEQYTHHVRYLLSVM
ncbi:hypothetical protein KC909_00345 [Candidatus Dojkabacteria bacterium]|uniref:Aldose 1-epimerase n=1 Tax=Candidatus Dojkabacteria bacterium TaxID=2099670 RepID=A0A955L4L5_9BACT|nr:hypothetical protein [Candidatus Dojkabacteria bacterium]